MFQLTFHSIEGKRERAIPSAGASVVFEGAVRERNAGKKVMSLEYEAMEILAIKEGTKIIAEAKNKFPISDAMCAHRIGLLQIGDIAIRVQVWSEHRKEAFEACQYIVDEVKARVPIWKKEHYFDGSSEWIGQSGSQGDLDSQSRGGTVGSLRASDPSDSL